VLINDGQDTISGRSIVNDRAICPQAQEHVPATETIRTLRAVNNTLGEGFVEAIDDDTLIAIANQQPQLSDGKIQGEVVQVSSVRGSGTNPGRPVWLERSARQSTLIHRRRLLKRNGNNQSATAATIPHGLQDHDRSRGSTRQVGVSGYRPLCAVRSWHQGSTRVTPLWQ